MRFEMSDNDYNRIWEVITARLGLEFPEVRRSSVIRNLASAANEFGFSHPDGFVKWLISNEMNKQEVEMLASYLTISETFFWREHNVFSAITDFILPELINLKKDGDKVIRIWSAGCSSGEEPFSLAIALQKTIPDIKEWNIKILATDINPMALKKAAAGIYTKWSFRNCPSWLRTNYFRDLGNERFEIDPKIREMVTFRTLNLTEDVFPSFNNDTYSMDIIFCRNVLMYFSDEWVNRISRNLYKSLNKDGWFVVASCELSSYVFPQFKPVNFSDAIIYRKGDNVLNSVTDRKGPRNHSVTSEDDLPERQRDLIVTNERDNPFFISDQKTPSGPDPSIPTEPDIELIQVDDPISAISKLANKGHLQEALSLCDEGISRDKLDIGLYSLRASIYQELERFDDAIASLKMAIYLDPNFVMGHFALGNLFIRQNKIRNAKMHFKNVLDLISKFENDEIIPESEGLSVKNIKDIVTGFFENQK